MSPTKRRDDEDLLPADEVERREAELLSRALEGPRGTLAPGEDTAAIDPQQQALFDALIHAASAEPRVAESARLP